MRGVLAAAVGLAAGIVVWARFVEPAWIETKRKRIAWRGPPMRVAFLADLHARRGDARRTARIVRRTLELAPDLILLGGDYVDGCDADPGKLAAMEPLAALHARYGVFGVLGNHDEDTSEGDPHRAGPIARTVQHANICLLENRHAMLPNGVAIVGVGSRRAGHVDAEQASAGLAKSTPTILVAHEPIAAARVAGFDLALAGHTHGGQACVPFTGVCPFLEGDMKRYRKGLYRVNGAWLYVSAGLGTSEVHARIGARPEITLIELVPKKRVLVSAGYGSSGPRR
jgi:predicted MPP superfamily phosphohydrolase